MENKKENEFTLIVNGEEVKEPNQVLTFVEVLNLAFPSPRPVPDSDYSITFKNASSTPRNGQLNPGGSVEVKNGTHFDVTPTNRS
jgi:Multiubiquitin